MPLYAEAEDSVSRLKDMLSKSTGVPAYKLKLMYNNRPLDSAGQFPYGSSIQAVIVNTLNIRTPNGMTMLFMTNISFQP